MYKLVINGKSYEVEIKQSDSKTVTAIVNGEEHTVSIDQMKARSTSSKPVSRTQSTPTSTHTKQSSPSVSVSSNNKGVQAPIPGQVKEIFAREGDKVEAGQKVLMLEAMKLENEVNSGVAGIVKKVLVNVGDTVNQDQMLIEIG